MDAIALLEGALRIGQTSGVEVYRADVLEGHRVARIDLEAAIEGGQRLGGAAVPRVGDAERVQGVEVRLGRHRLLQQLDGRGGLAGFAQVGAELNPGGCGRRACGKGVAQRGNRAGEIADAPEIEGEMTGRRHHVGPRGENLAVARDPVAQLALVVERHRLVHQAIDLDEPLRIVLLAVV